MILLDTNVLSALMRESAEPVVGWLNRQDPSQLWTSAVTIFESRHGLARMPSGRRQAALSVAFETLLREDLGTRVLGLDRAAAEAAGQLAARREAAGRNIEIRDTLIAGIAVANRASIATRNVRHFDDLPAEVLDPWAT